MLHTDIIDMLDGDNTARIPITGEFSVRISETEDRAYRMEYDGVGVYEVDAEQARHVSTDIVLSDDHVRQLRMRLQAARTLQHLRSTRNDASLSPRKVG